MERLQRIFGQTGMGQPGSDSPLLDSSEQVYISSLALLKMLKHGQSLTLTLTLPSPPPRPGEGSVPPGFRDRFSRAAGDAGRAGVPMEVMGLMLGEFVDDYTVRVVDVFAMPQSGTGVSVEAVDHAFQTNMLDMLKQTGRYAA
jgi:26S proteasome regulatory subunit N11